MGTGRSGLIKGVSGYNTYSNATELNSLYDMVKKQKILPAFMGYWGSNLSALTIDGYTPETFDDIKDFVGMTLTSLKNTPLSLLKKPSLSNSPVSYEILIPKGTNAMFDMTKHTFSISDAVKFKIVRVQKVNGKPHITLKLI